MKKSRSGTIIGVVILAGILLIGLAALSSNGLGQDILSKITGNAGVSYNVPVNYAVGQGVTIPAGSAYTFNLPQAMNIGSLTLNLKTNAAGCEVMISTEKFNSGWKTAGNSLIEKLGIASKIIVAVKDAGNCSSLTLADIELSGYSSQK